MALILRGNGAVTGLTAIPNNILTDANMPSGTVLQTVSYVNTSQVVINATTVAPGTAYDTYTTASITPSSASNKILIIASQSYFHTGGASAQGMGFRIQRDSTEITTESRYTASYTGLTERKHGYTSLLHLDSPNTTSSVTYTIIGYHHTSQGELRMQYSSAESPSTITLMEIAG